MSIFRPLPFQRKAIERLTETFLRLWDNTENQRHLVFKSPTGSGKTFMVCNFIDNLNNLPNWDYDKAIIWITFSDTLAMQSKEKFKEYFDTDLKNNLLTIEDFKQGKLFKNDVLFINWQKLVSKSAETRIIRRPDDEAMHKEQGYYFEDIIENTKLDGREIIMVIDESHTHLSDLAQKSVVDVVNPKVILNVSATPKYIPNRDEEDEGIAGYVRVNRQDVVDEGLIKEKIAIQTDEDLHKFNNRDLDELLIDLAISKKKEIEEEYKKLKKDINPLVLIQLPNDDSKLKDTGQKTKEEIVLTYLKKKGIDTERDVALWFDGKQKNMEFVTHNESKIDFMLFKQAAGTGWDCPRAHILVMYREINSPTFYTQTIGRILRMAEPNLKSDYANSPILRTGFLFTNYNRKSVSDGFDQSKDLNKPFIHTSKKVEGLSNIENLFSDFVSRADYGDLASSIEFQMSFLKSMDEYFDFQDDFHVAQKREKIEAKGVDLNSKLTNKIVVDAEFSDFDKLDFDFAKKGRDEEYEMSQNDVEKLFNYWCFKLLSEQTEVEAKVSNVARSWSPLKSALRVWFKRSLDLDSNYYYRIFIKDINKDQSSVFRPAITKALKDYYPIKQEVIKKRKEQIEKREAIKFEIKDEYSYTDDFAQLTEEEGTSKLSVVQPFFIRKEYKGRDNEIKFIKYLEQKTDSLEWWFKNGEGSKEYYCLKYFNTSTKEEALFYPDWILKFKDGRIGIFDTKSGFTAQNPEGRAEGLARKIKELNENGGNYIGGLVVLENNQWYYFTNEKYLLEPEMNKVEEPQTEYGNTFCYEYTPGKLNENWKPFAKLFE
jgi:type III restriction enzyme